MTDATTTKTKEHSSIAVVMSTATSIMVHHSSPQSSSKDPQSPTLSCTHDHPTSTSAGTSASVSDDDHHIKPARMGRVIYQEDEDYDDDPFPHAPQAQPQEGDEPFSHSLSITDNSDKLRLLQSIEIITQLAVMDRDEYQRRLVENSLPVVQQISFDNTDHSSHHTNNLTKLTQSLHRFHSLVANLERENDSQTLEIYKLQTQLENVKVRNQKLETAVQKLYKRNTKLKKEKAQQASSLGKKILNQVQKSKANIQEQHDFLKLANQVQQHEMALRERTGSNFSDVDGLETFYSTGSDIYNGDDSASSEADADASVSTATSLITDESAATVKISRERTFTWPKLPNCDDDDIRADPLKSKSTTTSPSKISSVNETFAAFLAPKPYTLSFVAPCAMQLVQIPIEATTTTPQAESASHAICICGYHGFDTDANVKPTLGARLLEINKQKMDPKWSLLEIEKHMVSQGKKTSMTFRNDAWDKKQKEILTAAVTQQEKLHPNSNSSTGNMLQDVRKRSQSGELQKNLLGFLNFNHHNHDEQRPTTSPEAKTTPPRPKPTTPSSQQADISPIQDMIAFLRTNHIANTTPEEGVTFDDQAAQVAFPTTPPEQALQDNADATVVIVDLHQKMQAVGTDNDSSLAIPNQEEKEQPATSTSTIDNTPLIATISTAATATAPKLRPKSPDVKAADAFKSSMKNMGKLFAFR